MEVLEVDEFNARFFHQPIVESFTDILIVQQQRNLVEQAECIRFGEPHINFTETCHEDVGKDIGILAPASPLKAKVLVPQPGQMQ